MVAHVRRRHAVDDELAAQLRDIAWTSLCGSALAFSFLAGHNSVAHHHGSLTLLDCSPAQSASTFPAARLWNACFRELSSIRCDQAKQNALIEIERDAISGTLV